MSEKEFVIVKRKERLGWNSYVLFKMYVKGREEGGFYLILKYLRMII